MKAVIYARYSCDNQKEESIEGQVRECREYAAQNGISVVGIYADHAVSARSDKRPEFQRMVVDSKTRKFQAVLVWKFDRFSRKRADSALYKSILKSNNVSVISITEPISKASEGVLLESLLEGMAEYYSLDLSEKVSCGHKENALKAKFNGGPVPLGYTINAEQQYEIDPAKAPIVREVFQRYADGEGVVEIMEDLNRRGIHNSVGKPFTKNSFQTLLKNRRYLGEYRYKDVVEPGAIPAIIDEDLFEQVQRRCEKNKKAPAHTKTDVNFMLTTKLFCGECGAMMAGESGTSKTGATHYYYKCGNRKRNGKNACDLKAVRKEPLEQFVVRVAVEQCLTDKAIAGLTKKLVAYQKQEYTILPVLRRDLREVQKRLDHLVDAIEQGMFSPTMKMRLDELEQRRQELEVSIAQEQIASPELTEEQIRFYLERFKKGNQADVSFQQSIIDSFVNSVYVFGDKLVVNFNCTDDNGRKISLEEVKSSILNGNGAPKSKPQLRLRFFFLACTMDKNRAAVRRRQTRPQCGLV